MKTKGYSLSENLELSLIRSARHLCTHTLAHRDELCSSLGIDPARIAVIPLGIPMPETPAHEEAKPKEKFVLIIGRFEVRKGIDLALAAIPLVMEKYPEGRFVFAGGAEDPLGWKDAFLRDHAQLADRVRFAGMVSEAELETLYRTCDFYVSPARYESFGLTYIEAMSHSKPVIGFLGSGGAEEVIGDGGLLVPQNDPSALAEAIGRLWNDRELHREFSVRARRRAEHFSIEREAELSEQYYAKILAGEV
jgi:glycosyltransferase involved in cell wall biosynthesis